MLQQDIRSDLAFCQELEDETHAIFNARRAKLAAAEAVTPGSAGETCDAWFDRYNAHAVELGQSDA